MQEESFLPGTPRQMQLAGAVGIEKSVFRGFAAVQVG